MSTPLQSPKLLLLVAAGVVVACAAFPGEADEFSWQLSGGASRTEAGDFDATSWGIDATYYMNPIDDGAGPYELASFLHPTTRVSASASSNDSQDIVDDPTAYSLSGAYVLPGDKWYVGASYATTDVEDASPFTRSDQKGYGVQAGRYLGPNTTLELGLGRSERSFESTIGCPPGALCILPLGQLTIDTTTDSVNLEVFHLRRFRSLTYSLEGSVSESSADVDVRLSLPLFPPPSSNPEDLRTYSVAAELFPTDRLGVRVGYSRPDRSVLDIEGYGVAATWFFKPRVAIQFSLSHTSVDNAPVDRDDPDGAAVRFIGRL